MLTNFSDKANLMTLEGGRNLNCPQINKYLILVRSELCAWMDWAFQDTVNLNGRMHSSHGR